MEQHHAAGRRRHRHGIAQIDRARRHFEAVAHAQVLGVLAVRAWEDEHRAVAVVDVVDGDGRGHGRLWIAVDLVVGPVVVDRKAVVVRRNAEEIHARQFANRLLVVELLFQQHRFVVHEGRHRAEQPTILCEARQVQAEIDDRLDLPHHDATVALAADVQPPALPLVGQRGVEHELENEVRIAAHGRHLARREDLRQHRVAVPGEGCGGFAFAPGGRRIGGWRGSRGLGRGSSPRAPAVEAGRLAAVRLDAGSRTHAAIIVPKRRGLHFAPRTLGNRRLPSAGKVEERAECGETMEPWALAD